MSMISSPQRMRSRGWSNTNQRAAVGLPGAHAAAKFDNIGVAETAERLSCDCTHRSRPAVDGQPGRAIGWESTSLRRDLIEGNRQVRASDIAFERHMNVYRHPIRLGDHCGEFVGIDQAGGARGVGLRC